MKTKQLGSQGLQIPLIGLGCMGMSPSINVNTYGQADENEFIAVAEITYQLGFERPQSLNRLFKKKTTISPLEYRESFN